jgi:pyruvate/2-oxoglutarate/acetoin dehydrogenase E1 component/TPP-dependent pyruvate/acetoin dehydrogenase alpha subunit
LNDLDIYRWLVVCRELDRALCIENPRWFPIEGEEATVLGSFVDLRPDDAVAPHYRDPFVVYLLRGAEMWRLAAQVLGKSAGYNKGRSVPFNGPVELGVVPWVAGDLGTTIGTATGAALAFQHAGTDQVCVCTFGDGTANRGDVHEALNLAACWQLPIVYVCQNNGWAISQAESTYLRGPVAARAAGYGIPGECVDGNDVDAVRTSVGKAVARARAGEGPTLIEARTWRWRGHWAGDDQTYRQKSVPDGIEDPIDLYGYRLLERGSATVADLQCIHLEVADEVRAAIAQAHSARDAGAAELGLDEVYAIRPDAGDELALDSSSAERLLSGERDKSPGQGLPSGEKRMTQTEAVLDALASEMRADPRVFYIGQDVGRMGGSLLGTNGLLAEFGPARIREAPISESAMVGAAIGAALFGARPVVEISFGEFLPAAMSQLVNQAPNLHYMTGGVARVPVVVRTRVGDGPYGGHPHDYSAWFGHLPGLKVVMPGSPGDARGLMLAALRDDNPVLFIEPMALAHGPRATVPDSLCEVPIGVARIARPGRDVTLVAIGSMVNAGLRAADDLASAGIDVEVVDLRSIQPLDTLTVIESVRRTGRLVTVHEAWVTGGIGAEIVAAVAEASSGVLRAPVIRVGTAAVPTPSGKVRPHALPNVERIVAAIRQVLEMS